MSIFRTESVTCPACGKDIEFEVVHSVNADRRPDLRTSILDGSFQLQPCGNCQAPFRLQPQMTYVDVGRGQWISAQPMSNLGRWQELEASARDGFAQAYGDRASPAAKAIGEELRPRLTFGWTALREKLLAGEHGLDDVVLELLKTVILRGVPGLPIADNNELRLLEVRDDVLILAWIFPETEAALETMEVPRGLYDDIAADPESWSAISDQLTDGPFVDMQKLMFAAA